MRSLALARGITYERAATTGAWGKKETRQVHLVHHHHHTTVATTSLTPTSIAPAHPVPLLELSVSELAKERERELERVREQEKAEERERERAQALETENELEREQERQREKERQHAWEAEAEMEGSAMRFQRFLNTPSHQLAAGRTHGHVSAVSSVTHALPLITSTLSPIGPHDSSSESCKVGEAGLKGTGGGREEGEADGGEGPLLGAGKKGMKKKGGASKATRTSSSSSRH